MHSFAQRTILGTLLLVPLLTMIGCADYELVVVNPWIRKQWREDEKFGPTLHQQLADLDRIRRSASRMPEGERQRHAEQLGALYQDEPSPVLRAAIARSLGALRVPAAAATLRVAVADNDRQVRIAACQGWADFGGSAATDALAEAVGGDTDLDVRLAATRALGQFEDRGSVRALGLALGDSDPALQRRAIESLRMVSDQDYGNDVVAWREFVRGGNPQSPAPPSIAERFGNLFR